ncbi:MAG: DUF6265 family protein [Gemmatimonadota bacterium]|nr:DUF6265 family protein [Gemmatimonadota bacterium]
MNCFRYFIPLVAVMTLATASLRAQQLDLDAANWLAGCWSAGSSERVVEEQWMAPRGDLLVGMSRSIRDGVATGHEFLLIRRTDGGVILSAHPSGQQPADFVGTVVTDQTLRFVNPSHDFPQKIEYHRISQDQVTAKVFGEVDAETPAFELQFERVPCGAAEGH